MSGPGIRGGVEYFLTGNTGLDGTVADDDMDVQCARCGSSVGSDYQQTLEGDEYITFFCLSGAEWCASHPMPGREEVAGAGR